MKKLILCNLLLLAISSVALAARLDMPVFDGECQISLIPMFDAPDTRMYKDGEDYRAVLTLWDMPDCNSWTYRIEDGGQFNYHYQPPFENPIAFVLDDEIWLREIQPDGVHQRLQKYDGSWAVYHKWKRDHILGQYNYKVGKAFHILAESWDDEGNEIPTRIVIRDGIYTVSVSAERLETAFYPVIVNDTFGGAGVGSEGKTEAIISDDRQCAWGTVTPSTSGTTTSISVYSRAGGDITSGIWNNNAGAPATKLVDTGNWSSGASDEWVTSNTDSAETVTASTLYWIGISADDSVALHYDAGGTADVKVDDTTYVTGVVPDWTTTASTPFTDIIFSMYVTYTASGGATATKPTTIFRRRRM